MRINNDTIKNPNRAQKYCSELLAEGKSVVIDNMNSTISQRSVFLSLAKKLDIPVRALYLQTDKETCMENNSLRKVHTPNI
jgi:bifunctional polynucleotide phosphatase/kinase